MIICVVVASYSANPDPDTLDKVGTLTLFLLLPGNSILVFMIGLFGISSITTEYRSGLIRSSFCAIPFRDEFVVAKAVAVAFITALVYFITTFLSYLIMYFVFFAGTQSEIILRLTDYRIWVFFGLSTLAIVLYALFSLGLGCIVHSQPLAIVVYILIVNVIPTILTVVSLIIGGITKNGFAMTLSHYLPTNALNSTQLPLTSLFADAGVNSNADFISGVIQAFFSSSQTDAFIILSIWTLIIFLIGILRVRSRNV